MISKPNFDKSVLVCPGAAIVGDVTLGSHVSIWYNAVLRGDEIHQPFRRCRYSLQT